MARGIDPAQWGPTAWHMLHAISFRVAARPRLFARAKRLVLALQELLPCAKCRGNLKRHMAALPLPPDAAGFPAWLYELHKRVTMETHDGVQPPVAIAMNEVRERWGVLAWPRSLHVEMAPFLEALAETHPGANAKNDQHLRATIVFWRALRDMGALKGIPASHMDGLAEAAVSRPAYRRWVDEILATHDKKNGHMALCTQHVCTMP